MFGCNVETFRNVVEGNNLERELAKASLRAALIALVVFVLLSLVLGPWLWNNVVRKLVPGTGRASWWHTVALAILLSLVALPLKKPSVATKAIWPNVSSSNVARTNDETSCSNEGVKISININIKQLIKIEKNIQMLLALIEENHKMLELVTFGINQKLLNIIQLKRVKVLTGEQNIVLLPD